MSLEGRVLRGRYKLDKHLADGGMGAVWTAEDLTLGGMLVAVKVMRVDCAVRADLRARFEQEAKAVALLRDPHIVQVLDYGTDDDTPFLVMELLEGIDLLATRDSTEAWPQTEIAGLVIQVAQGLGVAHRAGLIHRDVKPANIFLTRTDKADDVIVKVIDFGIAKWSENKEILTGANVVLGSPSYMSPEQIRGLKLDARADAWALAVVAFTLVTGNLPFVGKKGPDIAKQVVLGNRRKVTAPIQNANRLERFFTRAFAPDPAARFRSVEELAGEFVLVAGAPSPLRTAARAVAEACTDDGAETQMLPRLQELPKLQEDTGTTHLVKAPQIQEMMSNERTADTDQDRPEVEDFDRTETDDRLIPSGGAAGRTRSSG